MSEKMVKIASGDLESINQSNRNGDIVKAQATAITFEIVKGEMQRLLKLLDLYDVVIEAYENRIKEEADSMTSGQLAYAIDTLTKQIDRDLNLFASVTGNKMPDVVYIDNSVSVQDNTFAEFNSQSPASRQKIREAITKILGTIGQ